jgi:hypothetical protein
MKKTIISILASALIMFSLAGLFTGVLAKSFIEHNVDKTLLRLPPNLLMTFAGYFFLATLMALTYQRFVKIVINPTKSGLILGASFAVLWFMPYTLVLFSVYRFPYAALAIDLPWAFVEQGLGGLVIGLIQGRRSQV